MCQICYKENLEVLEGILIIEDCKNISTVPIIEGLQRISIRDCDNIMTIPIIEGLHTLTIYKCQSIATIPIIKGLHTLTIVNCNNITTIPIIEGLQALTIYNCNNITTIPTIKGLQELSVIRCKKISEKYYTKNLNLLISFENTNRESVLKILKNIDKFINYAEERNTLIQPTTMLSAYIKYGIISIREVYHYLVEEFFSFKKVKK